MAVIYRAPLPLSSVRLMAKYACSPSLWLRTRRIPSAAPFHSYPRKGTAGFRSPATRFPFSSVKTPSDGRKVTCEMPGYRPSAVNESTWNEYVMESDIPVLVEFWASWCGPCLMVHRVIEEIALEYAGKIKFFILNTDHDYDFATDYGVDKVPTVMVFKNGEKQASITGTMPNSYYVAAIEKSLAPSEGSGSQK